MAELYSFATEQANIAVTLHPPIYKLKKYNFSDNSKILVSNDDQIVGRTAKVRCLAMYMKQKAKDHYLWLLREAVY